MSRDCSSEAAGGEGARSPSQRLLTVQYPRRLRHGPLDVSPVGSAETVKRGLALVEHATVERSNERVEVALTTRSRADGDGSTRLEEGGAKEGRGVRRTDEVQAGQRLVSLSSVRTHTDSPDADGTRRLSPTVRQATDQPSWTLFGALCSHGHLIRIAPEVVDVALNPS